MTSPIPTRYREHPRMIDRPSQTPATQGRRRLVVGLLLALSLAGCSKPAPTIEDINATPAGTASAPNVTAAPETVPASTTPATKAPIVPGSPEDVAAVKEVIDRFYVEYAKAIDPPNPDSPALQATLTGSAATFWTDRLREHQVAGERARRKEGGHEPYSLSEPAIAGDNAVLRECTIDDFLLFDRAGAIIDDGASAFLIETNLLRENGVWLISKNTKLIGPSDGKTLCPSLVQN